MTASRPEGQLDAIVDSPLSNADLTPTPFAERSWGILHVAALWVAISVCIPTYMLAASMVEAGLNWWQSLLAILLGNAIVLIPLIIHGHAGTRYGIPFPVFIRAAFGPRGAHVPSLLRALVACGWFGIQTWIGGIAINVILGLLWTGWKDVGGGWTLMGFGLPDYLSFLLFWVINLVFVWSGTESIKWLETLAAPFLILIGLLLLGWAVSQVGSLSTILQESTQLVGDDSRLSGLQFVIGVFLPWLTAMVGYWATLSLNIPDFSRYVRSQRDQAVGQALGLLTAMPLFAFIGVAVTSATVVLYGEAIWNPVILMERLIVEYRSPWLGIGAMLALVLATLSTNIAANVVAPANSFSNLAPRLIGFRLGGLLAGLTGVLILPWKLLEIYQVWLISYSGLLGAVAGVLMCDYVWIRRGRLNLVDLYSERGSYAYTAGVNWRALLALAAGAAVALLGEVFPKLSFLFNGSWFFATAVSFLFYLLLMSRATAGGRS